MEEEWDRGKRGGGGLGRVVGWGKEMNMRPSTQLHIWLQYMTVDMLIKTKIYELKCKNKDQN